MCATASITPKAGCAPALSQAGDAKPAYLIEKLGERTELKETAFKRYPVGGPTQPAIQGMYELLPKIDRANVSAVRVEMPGRWQAFRDAAMPALNLRYTLSLMLIEGKLDFVSAQSLERMASDAKVRAMMERITIAHDPAQEAPAGQPRTESARLIVTQASGQEARNLRALCRRLPVASDEPRGSRGQGAGADVAEAGRGRAKQVCGACPLAGVHDPRPARSWPAWSQPEDSVNSPGRRRGADGRCRCGPLPVARDRSHGPVKASRVDNACSEHGRNSTLWHRGILSLSVLSGLGHRLLGAGVVAGAALAPGAMAQSVEQAAPVDAASAPGFDTVVVTARKRDETAQSVPISIDVFDQDAVDRLGIQTLEDLRYSSPSVYAAPSTFRRDTLNITIRGQQNFPSTGLQFDTSAAVYVDGVYYARPVGLTGALFDVADVQVLKGPQGTLVGRNSTGGAILYNTREPTSELEGYAHVTVGDYERREVQGAFNIPLGETLSIRVSLLDSRQNGYVKNHFLDPASGYHQQNAGHGL